MALNLSKEKTAGVLSAAAQKGINLRQETQSMGIDIAMLTSNLEKINKLIDTTIR